jgi:hypothetical protein
MNFEHYLNPTDPALDMEEKGVVVTSRRQNALVKDLLRIKVAELESWLNTYKGVALKTDRTAAQRALLEVAQKALKNSSNWTALSDLKK